MMITIDNWKEMSKKYHTLQIAYALAYLAEDKNKTKSNRHEKQKPLPSPKGPSKWVRDEYIKKVNIIIKKNPPQKPK